MIARIIRGMTTHAALPPSRRDSAPIFRSATRLLAALTKSHVKDVLGAERWPEDELSAMPDAQRANGCNDDDLSWAAEVAGRGVADCSAPASAGATALKAGLQFTFDPGFDSIAVSP